MRIENGKIVLGRKNCFCGDGTVHRVSLAQNAGVRIGLSNVVRLSRLAATTTTG